MKLDILGIVAHPDDVELSFGGTMILHQKKGYKTGVIDLTRGELGTRGTPEIRADEARLAGTIMNLSVRENLKLEDGFFDGRSKENQVLVAKYIRKYRPEIVITNATYDRHPDHGRAAQLVESAAFIAGLKAVETTLNGEKQEAWRPKKTYYCIQSTAHVPDLLVDISEVIEERRAAIRAFKSQFYDPESKEPETYISSENFMEMLEGRAREWGQRIGAKYAEGFTVKHSIGVRSLFDLI